MEVAVFLEGFAPEILSGSKDLTLYPRHSPGYTLARRHVIGLIVLCEAAHEKRTKTRCA